MLMEINWVFFPVIFTQLDIMEPKVPDDIYKTHLENNSKAFFLFLLFMTEFFLSPFLMLYKNIFLFL